MTLLWLVSKVPSFSGVDDGDDANALFDNKNADSAMAENIYILTTLWRCSEDVGDQVLRST